MIKFLEKLDKFIDSFTKVETVSNELNKIQQAAKLTYPNVPKKWQWITKIPGLPAMVSEALKEVGTLEAKGSLNNKKIIKWVEEVRYCKASTYNNWVADWYNKDSIPWCGLFLAVIACRSAKGKPYRLPVNKYLTALAWANWGESVDFYNVKNIYCGDVAVFTRAGGGHVAIVIGVSSDGKYLLCVGGNQDDQVNIKLFPIERVYAIRRPKYTVRPKGARHINVATSGAPISDNEQ